MRKRPHHEGTAHRLLDSIPLKGGEEECEVGERIRCETAVVVAFDDIGQAVTFADKVVVRRCCDKQELRNSLSLSGGDEEFLRNPSVAD